MDSVCWQLKLNFKIYSMEEKQTRLKDRFAKWRLISIDELGKVVNLLLGISFATLGYQINFLVDEEYIYKGQEWLFTSSVVLILASIALGLITTFNRLLDFRWTSLLLKMRMDEESKENVKSFKERIDKVGERSWILFSWQITTFSFGILVLTSFFFYRYIIY
jgi:hypothetical protein